ncbi:MAG: hypothetical protein H0X29_02935 [Parachlamydiaceae bacterium]|nr:hypothetical protein [Parachlamydiaceae bacterium]
MGRYCTICAQIRSNERFYAGGHGGHKNGICKQCQKLPKGDLNFINAREELFGYWEQSNISSMNINRINQLLHFPSEEIQKLAQITYDVASVKPHKKKRLGWLRKNHRDLYDRMITFFGEDFDENFYEYENGEDFEKICF